MRGKFELLMVIAALSPLGGKTQGISSVAETLEAIDCWQSIAGYSITLPQATDDVVYSVDLESKATPSDPISPADYLIRWNVDTPSGRSEGFSAYFSGHHYRFRDQRLQEYHWEWDSIPFIPRQAGATRSEGVHKSAQFVNLLPQFIAEDLRRMSTDSLYSLTIHPDTVIASRHCTVIDAIMSVQGYVCSEISYTFSLPDMYPVSIESDFNPGSLSEQTVSVKYTYPSGGKNDGCAKLSEESLISMYPQLFEKYRQSNFRIENLPGTRLPGFSLPTPTGERYSRLASDSFRSTTVVALLDAGGEFTSQIITDIRSAIDRMPADADVIYAFIDNRAEDIDEVIPRQRPGEHILMSSGSLARDCGAAAIPVIIICHRSGEVSDVRVGYNKDLTVDVIQMTALADQ